MPDLLGFGHSPHPATGYSPDDHANAFVGCLYALGITEPVTIGAYSPFLISGTILLAVGVGVGVAFPFAGAASTVAPVHR